MPQKLQKCCYFLDKRCSTEFDMSVKKLWFSTLQMRISSSVSMLSLANMRYTLVRSHDRCWANHTTLRSWRSNSVLINVPTDMLLLSPIFIQKDAVLLVYSHPKVSGITQRQNNQKPAPKARALLQYSCRYPSSCQTFGITEYSLNAFRHQYVTTTLSYISTIKYTSFSAKVVIILQMSIWMYYLL